MGHNRGVFLAHISLKDPRRCLAGSGLVALLGLASLNACGVSDPAAPVDGGETQTREDSGDVQRAHGDAATRPDAPTRPDAAEPPDADTVQSPDATLAAPCNGAAVSCDRPFNEVAQACTHNAMSSKAYRFIIPTPNQMRSLTEQLDSGVRCLMLDTYAFEDELYLCHGVCGNWGKLLLADALAEIAAWLRAHPRDIVTFILEAKITEPQTLGALAAAGLASADGMADARFPLFHAAGGPGTPWPTLRDMIETNARLVVFTDDPAATGGWHLHWPSWGWETPYNDPTFTCAHGRGDPGGNPHPVFILNHYSLGAGGGDERISTGNNAYDSILEHGRRCAQVTPDDNPLGVGPTFVNVDHFHVPTSGGETDRPDVVDAVDAFNEDRAGDDRP